MTEEKIRELVSQLDAKRAGDAEQAWMQLKPLGEAVVPYLAEGYGKLRKSQGRVACVFHLIRFARTSEAAFQLGLRALDDKATLVRYRACGLLAYSLRSEAIPSLKKLLDHADKETVADARAAIDAIKSANHHRFVDRDHDGRTFWSVNDEDSRKDLLPDKSWWKFWQ